ncbi:MAG TPA: cyclic beta 1-2 glucan synthetase, partial [Burkholderiaceae bacterium]
MSISSPASTDLSPSLAGDTAAPLRAELYSATQMAQHGRLLATRHRIVRTSAGDRLLARLTDNDSVITEAVQLLTDAVKAKRQITPAGEWLLDNYYLIEQQIAMARRHLPKGYSKQLPVLDEAEAAEPAPRAYALALEAVAHGDGRIDPESLARFIAAYQEHSTLQLGELWAIPIMLRLALIENLRRVAARILLAAQQRDQANAWAERMMDIAERKPADLILLVADMARAQPQLSSAYVAELARRLQNKPALTLPLTWVAQRLAESNDTIDQMVQSETQNQAAAQVSIANSIGSLRLLATLDWREFVETHSAVEQLLLTDVAGLYGRMDFATRDHYRHMVERLARKTGLDETEVARRALYQATRAAGAEGRKARSAHVGFYLTGPAMRAFESSLEGPAEGALAPLPATDDNRGATVRYLAAIAGLTLLFAGGMTAHAWQEGWRGWTLLAVAGVGGLAASQLALVLVNWLCTLITYPRPLP